MIQKQEYGTSNIIFLDFTVMPVESTKIFVNERGDPVSLEAQLPDKSIMIIPWSRIHCVTVQL